MRGEEGLGRGRMRGGGLGKEQVGGWGADMGRRPVHSSSNILQLTSYSGLPFCAGREPRIPESVPLFSARGNKK